MNAPILAHAKERERALRRLRGEKTFFEKLAAALLARLFRGCRAVVYALLLFVLAVLANVLASLIVLYMLGLVAPRQAPRIPEKPAQYHVNLDTGARYA